MCGIAGAIGGKAEEVVAMLARIKHRGPDGEGLYDHEGVIHGHVRLALVDLSSASAQPFRRDGGTLSFVGEIWNYRGLRDALQADGERFVTTGDTEVLLAMLNRFGLKALDQIDGMFAFTWSSTAGEHWLVRDRFGKIPLYVAKTPKGYSWGSERKAFRFGTPAIAVPPGYAFNLRTGEWLKWYELPPSSPLSPARVLDLLRVAVAKRLAADAPVCCLISGGLDSGVILALAEELRPDVVAFTAVYDPNSADARAARRLCAELGVKLIEVPVTLAPDSLVAAIHAIEIASKAQVEIAALCLPLARRIYAEGFRACLSGEAADELFGGYGNFCIQAARLDDAGIVKLRQQALAKMARGNFIRCNKAFMQHGVECRLPFMERELVEAAVQLGRADSPPGKGLLKTAVKDLLPGWVVKRPKDTFQGGSGIADAIQMRIPSPVRFYNAETRRLFGHLTGS